MSQVIQNTPRNNAQPLTKCGEIYINDGCTDAYLFCTFCSNDAEGVRFLSTLHEFIDHIKWHRSEDFLCTKDDAETVYEICKLKEVDSGLCNPPDMDPIEVEASRANVKSRGIAADMSENVLIAILDLYKKCPCLWHKESAEKSTDIIEPTYKMLAAYYNKCAKQNKSVEYVKAFIAKIRDGFLEEFLENEETNDSLTSPQWYFPHLTFLLMCAEKQLDESIYTDFECNICTQELSSQENLFEHIYQCHLELDDDDLRSPDIIDGDNSMIYENAVSEHDTSHELLETFIDTYKAQPHLWNRRNKDYHNRKLRNESYSILLKVLLQCDPSAKICDVIAKIKSLRTKFAYEKRKIEKNALLGAIYEPRIWYYEQLLFLADEIKSKSKPRDEENKALQRQNIFKKISCSVCDKSFTERTSWLAHVQFGHDQKAFQSPDGLFYCPICNTQNKTQSTFIRHLRYSHTNDLKVCQDCGIKFTFMSALRKHRANVHQDNNPFKCEECGKGFVNLCRMKAHAIIHWDVKDRPHVCDHCGAKFSNRANLKVHIRRHTRDFYFRCEICNHKSATSTELRFHMLTHTKEYPCMCDICGKGFRSGALLTSHQNECHSEEIFSCELCDKQFQSVKKLQYHYQSHKPVADQECEICGKKFFRRGSVRKHMRLKHEEPLEEVMLEFEDDLE